jgi:hypothetical protein
MDLSRGLGDVYKRQHLNVVIPIKIILIQKTTV